MSRAKATALPAAPNAAPPARVPLMLLAPVETLLIPGLNAIPTMAELRQQRDALPLARPTD